MRRVSRLGIWLALVVAATSCALPPTGIIALADAAVVPSGGEVTIPVLANDRPPPGETLRVTATQGGRGVVTIDPAGRLVYRAPEDFSGEDRFSYSVNSDSFPEAEATVVVMVTGSESGDSPFALAVGVVGLGTVLSQPSGIECPEQCAAEFGDGSEVNLVAIADEGYEFAGWSGDCAGSEACSILMSSDRMATAFFTEIGSSFGSLSIGISGQGSIITSPSGIDCGVTCSAEFEAGTIVALSAIPDDFWSFARWSGGACQGITSPSCQVVIGEDVTEVFASFESAGEPVTMYGLDVEIAVGDGSVMSEPAGIDCGLDCSHEFEEGTEVVLEAVPAPGWVFVGWDGSCAAFGADPTCGLDMHSDHAVFATFEAVPVFGVDVAIAAGDGSVVSEPAGIDCGGDCFGEFEEGTTLVLTAVPAPGWEFAGWQGSCFFFGVDPTCVLEMYSDWDTVFALFTMPTFLVEVGVPNGGSVVSDPSGIDCGGDCSNEFVDEVVLTAVPEPNWLFAGWGGACETFGTNECVLNADSNYYEVSAFFQSILR